MKIFFYISQILRIVRMFFDLIQILKTNDRNLASIERRV